MPEPVDPLRFPLQHHLDALTTRAGWHVDPEALDPTLARFGDLVTTLIDATARHAAATHLWHLLDGPLSFLLEVIGDGPIDTHEADLLQLTTLLQLRGRVREQREHAAQDLSDVCDYAVGLTTPATHDIPQHHSSQADRDTALLAALVDAAFLTGLTEHHATTRSYQRACDSDTVHAELAADGSFTLHSSGTDGREQWQVTASGGVPLRVLTALIRACATAVDLPPASPPSAPQRP